MSRCNWKVLNQAGQNGMLEQFASILKPHWMSVGKGTSSPHVRWLESRSDVGIAQNPPSGVFGFGGKLFKIKIVVELPLDGHARTKDTAPPQVGDGGNVAGPPSLTNSNTYNNTTFRNQSRNKNVVTSFLWLL